MEVSARVRQMCGCERERERGKVMVVKAASIDISVVYGCSV